VPIRAVTTFPLPGEAIQRLATNPSPSIPRGTIATFGALEADIRNIGSLARLLVTYVDNYIGPQPDADALSFAAGSSVAVPTSSMRITWPFLTLTIRS
jgi:hypothetical protein